MNKKANENTNNILKNKIISLWIFLIHEYELVKTKQHPKIKNLNDFYQLHHIKRQFFLKYYARFQLHHTPEDLLPKKRGPRHTINPVITAEIKGQILCLRQQGKSLTEIYHTLKQNYFPFPSISRIYQIIRQYNLHRLSSPLKNQRQKYLLNIIKHHPGDLGHIDYHTITYNSSLAPFQCKHILGLMDDATRLVVLIPLKDLALTTVARATSACLAIFKEMYHIQFKSILSDNGIEFGGGPNKKNKATHPFEILLSNWNIKHLFTSVQHPETNGKIERFWKTIKEDILSYPYFPSERHFLNALAHYVDYYNQTRYHASISGTPFEKLHTYKKSS